MGVRRSFYNPDCSGTASQATPQGRRRAANAAGEAGHATASGGTPQGRHGKCRCGLTAVAAVSAVDDPAGLDTASGGP